MNIQSSGISTSDIDFNIHNHALSDNKDETFWQFLNKQGQDGEISRKGIKLAIFLCFISISCLLIGLVEEWRHWDPTEGISFLILFVITGLPGFFVFHNLVKAWKEPNE